MKGPQLWGTVFSLFLAGCSCTGIVIDSSDAGTGGTGAGGTGAGGTGNGGAGGEVDAGETLIEPRSGDVLIVQGVSVDGHPVSVESVRDGAHDTDCSLQRSRDGSMRCLPSSAPPVRVKYTDSKCELPVVVVGSGVPCTDGVPRYAIQESTGDCSAPGVAVFSVGTPIAPPQHVYEANAFGCNEVPTDADGGYYAATPSPPSEWVTFEHRVRPVTHQLGVAYWAGNDGSRLIDGPWLLEQDSPCRQETDETKVSRCFPTRRSGTDPAFFTDSTCTTRVVATILCDVPYLIDTGFSSPMPPCGVTLSGTWFTSKRMDSQLVYSRSDGTCAPSKYGGFKYYAPDAPVRFDSFPPIERTHEGDSRIQRVFLSSEGTHLYADGLYDTKFSRECRPTTTTAGTVCAATGDRAESFFADAACGVPLYAQDESECGPPPEFVSSGPMQACQPLLLQSVRLVLQAHSGPVFQGQMLGACSPADAGPGVVFYEVGEPVQPEAVFESLSTSEF